MKSNIKKESLALREVRNWKKSVAITTKKLKPKAIIAFYNSKVPSAK